MKHRESKGSEDVEANSLVMAWPQPGPSPPPAAQLEAPPCTRRPVIMDHRLMQRIPWEQTMPRLCQVGESEMTYP